MPIEKETRTHSTRYFSLSLLAHFIFLQINGLRDNRKWLSLIKIISFTKFMYTHFSCLFILAGRLQCERYTRIDKI